MTLQAPPHNALFFFSSRRRHTRSLRDWSSDVCSSDLYRGWDGANANHNYNWHDSIHNSSGNPCGNDLPIPCDDFFYGPLTTGTALGDDGMGNQIGMAPCGKRLRWRPVNLGHVTRDS